DASLLADRLMEARRWDIIADNLEKFPQGSVDASLLADRLMEARRWDIIVNNLEKFLRAGVNAPLLAERLMKAGQGDLIADNLEKFRDQALSPEILGKLHIPIQDALLQHRYLHVSLWLQNMSQRYGTSSIQGFFDQEAVQKVWNILVRDKRRAQAQDLSRCMALTGLTPPSLPEDGSPQEESRPSLPETRVRVVVDEVLEFYTDSFISHLLLQIQSTKDWKHKLEFHDRSQLESMKGQIQERREDLVSWMRRYMVTAVASELSHQPDEGLRVPPGNPDAIFFAGDENVLDFFDASSAVFVKDGWSNKCGGSSWARVARAGYALFASRGDLTPIVDYIFDLEHNTGAIFDKRPDEVLQKPKGLQALLEMKRHEDLPDMLSKLESICSPEALSRVQARLRIAQRLKKKVTGKV
ncbi:MAG: hypothetical protein AAB413_02140, partial [Patescibacteria group bacterium]